MSFAVVSMLIAHSHKAAKIEINSWEAGSAEIKKNRRVLSWNGENGGHLAGTWTLKLAMQKAEGTWSYTQE